jgi:hypothetical protein
MYQIKENEMDRACGTHGRRQESLQGIGGEDRRKETISKTMAQMGGWDQNGCKGVLLRVEWIQVAQDRDWWQDLVNKVMHLRVLTPQSCLFNFPLLNDV